MPTAYRVEAAKTARAVCRNKECKDAAVKIQKGELRFGTLVTIPTGDGENTSWHWRHWGCVTPLVLSNLSDLIDGDYDLVDGLDELPSDYQDKVKAAIEQGHVDDEDWKGDPEVNRPGMKGFRVKTPKKKTKKQEDDGEDEDKDIESPSEAKPKKRGRAKKDVDEGEEAEAPAPKKARGRPKKAANGDSVSEPVNAGGPEAAPKKRKSTKKASKVAEEEVEEAAEATVEEPVEADLPKANQGRKKKGASTASKANGARQAKSASDEVTQEPKPKKRGRPSKKAT